MPGTHCQSGVSKRRNRILKDMVRSMITYIIRPESLWSEALKTTVYLLNRVPRKIIVKNTYEFWTENLPALDISMFGLFSWSSTNMPHEKKLDSGTISCFFVRDFERSWGFRFYCPFTKNIIEMNNSKFIEDIQNSGIRISHLRKNKLLYQWQLFQMMK